MDNEDKINEENVDSIEEDETNEKPITTTMDVKKIEVCKINYISNYDVSVDFQGYGIMLHLKEDELEKIAGKKEIKIAYSGEIGNPDFECELD